MTSGDGWIEAGDSMGLPVVFPGDVAPAGGVPLMANSVDDARMLIAVGRVVREHSMLDQGLRSLFCALMDSKYAVVISAGQPTSTLVVSCRRLAVVRDGVSAEQRDDLLAILVRVNEVTGERNRFVHDVWAHRAGGQQLMRGRQGSHDLTFEPVDAERLETAVQDVSVCIRDVHNWITEVLGFQSHSLEVQLRWEEELRRRQ